MATKKATSKSTVKAASATKAPAKKAPATKAAAKKAPAKKAPAKKAAEAGASGDGAVFQALRSLLVPFAKDLVVVHDNDKSYYLDAKTKGPNGKPLFFGATRAGKAYTSYYLFCVYMDPAMLEGMSPELKKRMQGKSCFNFKKVEPALFAELGELTRRGFEDWKRLGRI